MLLIAIARVAAQHIARARACAARVASGIERTRARHHLKIMASAGMAYLRSISLHHASAS